MAKFKPRPTLQKKLSKDKQFKVNDINSFLHKEGLGTEEKKQKWAYHAKWKQIMEEVRKYFINMIIFLIKFQKQPLNVIVFGLLVT